LIDCKPRLNKSIRVWHTLVRPTALFLLLI